MAGLEGTDYDRPSFYSSTRATRVLGRLFAVMDKHITEAHRAHFERDGSVAWTDMCCDLCGFDARAEAHRLWPEGWD